MRLFFVPRVTRDALAAVAMLATLGCSSEEGDPKGGKELGSSSGGLSSSGGSSAGGSNSGGTGGDASSGGTGNGGSGASGGTPGAGGANDDCDPSLTQANKAAAEDAMVRLLVETDETAFEEYWADPYLQHNPVAQSGVDAFWSFFGPQVQAGNPLYSLTRVIGQCELVLTHGTYSNGVIFDMFRLEGGKLVEHWDAAAVGPGPNASGHTALDGPTEPTDLELTTQNQEIVLEFTEIVLIGGDDTDVASYMNANLIEHNSQGIDGRDEFLQYREENSITYAQVHHFIADGNFVFTMTEGALNGTPYGFYDLYRVEAGLIAEHWEARRVVPATTASGLPIF